jgi:hypothetical protein
MARANIAEMPPLKSRASLRYGNRLLMHPTLFGKNTGALLQIPDTALQMRAPNVQRH